MKRFHKRRQVVVTQDIKSSSLSLDQSLNLALSFFCSLAYLWTRLSDIWTSPLLGVGWRTEKENVESLKGATNAQDTGCWVLDLYCHHPLFRSVMYSTCHHFSLLLVVIKNTHATCSNCQSTNVLATATCCILRWLTKAWVINFCFFFSAPQKGVTRLEVEDYQRNMMSKGKLHLCARPTGSQGWEAAQTEWMYLLFMWKSMGPDRWFISSLFTPRLHDKCPHCPSWANGAQVSKKKSSLALPTPNWWQMCYLQLCFFVLLNPIPFLCCWPTYGLETALNTSKEKVDLLSKLLHQINIIIFNFIRNIGHIKL